jgi:hypothetical protein
MAKKKKQSLEERHRQLQNQVQALPYAIAQMEKEGKRGKAFMLKYVSGPIVRFMNRMMDRQRYAGPEGVKLKQSEKMKRHLEQRQKAMEYVQGELRKNQKRQQKRGGGGRPK